MEDFSLEKYVLGKVHCSQCGQDWLATVIYGQFFTLICPNCGSSIGSITITTVY